MTSLKFKIMPRFINGVDMAPESARKSDKAFIQHEQYAVTSDGILYVTNEDESGIDALLNDVNTVAVVEKLAYADELEAAILADGVTA